MRGVEMAGHWRKHGAIRKETAGHGRKHGAAVVDAIIAAAVTYTRMCCGHHGCSRFLLSLAQGDWRCYLSLSLSLSLSCCVCGNGPGATRLQLERKRLDTYTNMGLLWLPRSLWLLSVRQGWSAATVAAVASCCRLHKETGAALCLPLVLRLHATTAWGCASAAVVFDHRMLQSSSSRVK